MTSGIHAVGGDRDTHTHTGPCAERGAQMMMMSDCDRDANSKYRLAQVNFKENRVGFLKFERVEYRKRTRD